MAAPRDLRHDPWQIQIDICMAARIGDQAAMDDALARGADPNLPAPLDSQDRLPLAHAIEHRCASGVRLLRRAGADPNAIWQRYSATMLCVAAGAGLADIVAALLDAGADIERRSPQLPFGGIVGTSSPTALLCAALAQSDLGADAVSLLLARGGDPRAVCDGTTRFDAICFAAASSSPRALRLLAEAGCPVDEPAASAAEHPKNHFAGWAPIHFAAAAHSDECLQALLDFGADLGAVTGSSQSVEDLWLANPCWGVLNPNASERPPAMDRWRALQEAKALATGCELEASRAQADAALRL